MRTNIVINADCLEYMKTLPNKSIDLVLTDPPYFGIVKDERDNQRENREKFIDWLEECTKEWKRILKDNGSLYIFWDDKIIAYVQVMIDKYFKLENSIVRYKPNNMTIKGWNQFRSYATVTERLLFYSYWEWNNICDITQEQKNMIQPILDYMIQEKDKIKKLKWFNETMFSEYINNITDTSNVVSRHYFTYSQRSFATEELYKKLQTTCFFQKPYEELRREYEELRRPFNPKSNYTDVRKFDIITQAESKQADHPTQKPINIIKRIIDTSSKEWDIVLDCFAWSWTTGVACKELWRNYILIEKEKKYCDIIEKRLKHTTVSLFH